ncbi:hypothetical protein KDL45_04425 [bacterium]|nr:hypothetical protein [bacterium]MCB9476211.1 hypothetical protein [Deltaproteobacteria bacterium]MCB9479859.1 hypothetical protein [Deltaproteobacteria bacterium]
MLAFALAFGACGLKKPPVPPKEDGGKATGSEAFGFGGKSSKEDGEEDIILELYRNEKTTPGKTPRVEDALGVEDLEGATLPPETAPGEDEAEPEQDAPIEEP